MKPLIQGHNFLAWIVTADGLVAIDAGWDLYRGLPEPDSDVAALSRASQQLNRPLTHILLTHDHTDHVAGLGELLARWPNAEVMAHANTNVAEVTRHLEDGETLTLGGVRLVAHHTPGHSAHRDELSFWLPDAAFLFCGDLAQPQGPSYSYANGPSPVPFFVDGDAYQRSLERLIALDPQQMRTGHGDLLGPEQSRQWLRVTLAVVQRIEELAFSLVERYPERSDAWLIEGIYDQVVEERGFGLRRARQRKSDGTDYERFDVPGLRWAVQAARGVG